MTAISRQPPNNPCLDDVAPYLATMITEELDVPALL